MTQNQDILCPACHHANAPQARYCWQCSHDVILNNLGPRYFLTRLLKAGGQGAVFQGRDEAGQIYAIKEMLDSFSDPTERAEAVARFQAEAAMLRQLTHANIPRFYASFDDEGRHYLVMDFIKGEDLEDIVEREGAQPEARVLAWAATLCDVLEYMHSQGLIYRDMKPANVMLEQATGRLKLIDFSIAKPFQPSVRGTQIGTPGYAPPEQYQGLATKQSDIYALGATLHHLLSGHDPDASPFKFAPLRTLVPTISPQTEAAVARALEMRQADRFQSIAELRAALFPAPAAPQVHSPRTMPVAPPSAPPRPSPASPPLPPAPAPAPSANPISRVVWAFILGIISFAGVTLFTSQSQLSPSFPLSPPPPTITPDTRPSELRTIVYTLEISFDADHELNWTEIRGRFIVLFQRRVRADYACCDPSLFATPTFMQGPELIGMDGEKSIYQATLGTVVLLYGEEIPNLDEEVVTMPSASIMGDWLPELVHVPAGPFLMGGRTPDSLSLGINEPQHTLTLPDYWIGKVPITNAQFRPFVESDGYQNQSYWTVAGWAWREQEGISEPLFWHDERLNRDDQPVVGVSWYEAVAYVRWLSATTGHPFRLPTEAEWEKAARGPDGQIYPWGNQWNAHRLNHVGNNLKSYRNSTPPQVRMIRG